MSKRSRHIPFTCIPALRLVKGLILSTLVFWAGSLWAADPFTSREIADHVLLVEGPSGNTLVAEDKDGLILIEGVPAKYADDYLAYVRKATGQDKVKSLVITNWHDDSSGLDAAARKAGADVIAHFNTKQWLSATIRKRGDVIHQPVDKAALPSIVFHDTYKLPFRGGDIELGYMVQAHTDGDIYAYFPQRDVLFTGPVMHSDAWSPVDETTNGYIGGLMDAYDQLEGIIDAKTVIVPASGKLMGQAGFTEQVAMYKDLMKEMVALLRKSRSAEEVVQANPAVGLMPSWGDPSAFLDQGFRSFYGHLRDTRHVGVMP